MSGDLISRKDAIEAALTFLVEYCGAAFDEDMQKMLCERLDALSSAEPEPKWIPVTEALPKNHEDVLVYGIEAINNKYIYAVRCWDVEIWRPLSAPSVSWIAWQPLPEPWRGEK